MDSVKNLKNKIPPNNIEAEKAVLGAILIDPDVFTFVRPILDAGAFYSPQHQKIYNAIAELDTRSQKADILILTDYLRSTNELDSVGGAGYIASLTDEVPSSANFEFYAKMVLEAAIRRNLLKVSNKISADVFDDSISSRTVLEEAQKSIFDLTEAGNSATFKSLAEVIMPTLEVLEKMHERKGEYTGVPSGFANLDNMTYGFQNSEFIIIGARPSVGKTALAMTMAAHIAIDEKIPTAFFSLEMSDMQLVQRLIASRSKINSNRIRSANLTARDFTKVSETCGALYEAPFYLVDMPNMKLLDLRAIARQLCSPPYNVRIIFIDYITLITGENASIQQRHEQIAEISRSLKSLARELNIPVVALSQLTRDAEGKKPGLADIRESGSLEQDADVVMFLHRERVETSEDEAKPIPTELILAKQRNGPIGTVSLLFLPQYTTFVTEAKEK
ncbi:replicative DNA helicase [Treponema putidum]|uniref:Replicative DNA helicase n=1 Tax=Treponema putidum TaxID=221027 RepID=A0AAE9MV93_9SPIR|nr:replicative DNA helicase [Treponema putidum]AIN94531.1 DNA helicase [Treponema putidum]TWI78873.1 primary replicative DNA helicase [Treponema putidum]UTY28534.1 replicative DNA helicase [Treponema putidum]UTY33402.1 replicative DNA helicase [Treponema putidum]